MADPAIATAADYADAMIAARRAKNVIVLIILMLLLVQLGLFFTARYTDGIIPVTGATTQPSERASDLMQYLTGASIFLGVTLSIVLSFVLMLILKIMLVGRLIGAGRLTSAWIWSIVLMVLLFPWQAFLSNATFSSPEFKIPGVLYLWDELRQFARFPNDPLNHAILKWARFVAFPALAVVLVMLIQVKSNRGLRQAFGEADEPVV